MIFGLSHWNVDNQRNAISISCGRTSALFGCDAAKIDIGFETIDREREREGERERERK